jgi:hypothetical protein
MVEPLVMGETQCPQCEIVFSPYALLGPALPRTTEVSLLALVVRPEDDKHLEKTFKLF